MSDDLRSFPTSASPPWPPGIARTVGLDDIGLVCGAGTVLARMAKDRSLALDTRDRERLLALLSVAARREISADALYHIESAAGHWRRGDKALANFRLVFSGLPRLDEPADAWRLRLAEGMLDAGVPPCTLMAELGLDPAAPDLGKSNFNPYQPRVPAGNGQASGQWEAIWNRIISWLDEPVPEYDLDDGTQVGTRTRGRAIATNPLTILGVWAAGLLGAEAVVGAGIDAGFSSAEMGIISEAKSIVTSSQMADLAAAHAARASAIANVSGRFIQYEPALPASGMSLFGENGFLMGPEAFSSDIEHNQTVLHELYRLKFTESAGGVSAELATHETRAAADFAERASRLLP